MPVTEAEKQYRATVRIETACSDGAKYYGSGVIVGSHKVLTATHVIQCEDGYGTYKIMDSAGNIYAAEIGHEAIITDASSLLAHTPLPNAKPDLQFTVPGRGSEICSVGGDGRTHLLRKCGEIIEKTGKVIPYSDWRVYAYATSICIVAGNSGGPVFYNGKVIGLVVASRQPWKEECVGYFVPMSYMKHIL